MNRKWADGVVAALVLTVVAGTSAWAQNNASPKPNAGPAVIKASQTADEPDKDPADLSVVAIDRAAKENKYLFLFFYRTADEPTKEARKAFDAAAERLPARARFTVVDVADPLEQEVVAKYQLDRSPLPLVLALAPNGAITRSFGGPAMEAQFEAAFVSPGMQKSLKALQARKLVFVCVQNGKTQHNAEAMQGVKEFVADEQYAKTTEIVTVDPTNADEESFLKRLAVDPQTEEAVTLFLAPPGTRIAAYTGETKKDVLMAAAKTAAKGCTPGSSCCPAKKPGAQPPAPGTPGPKCH